MSGREQRRNLAREKQQRILAGRANAPQKRAAPADDAAGAVREPGESDEAAPATGTAPDPLVIRTIEYLGPMASATGWRPEARLPEIAFSGRSNVGKSSLINRLTRRKQLARVSNTPGRTREIHFFNVNDQFALVDLPGYGYARISKTRQAEWLPLIEGFLRGSTRLHGVVQLLDVRREPTEDDWQMLDFLAELGVPTIIAVTKVDKLSRSAQLARVEEIARAIGVDPQQCIPFSAYTGQGRDELAGAMADLLAQPSWQEPDPAEAPAEGAPGEGASADGAPEGSEPPADQDPADTARS